ncbi:uncharacterized protein N7483_001533 [Penicillium malachiteum]|uniref:uncharacterized protein n=1 Tax=Penicillium malachiteum TaxID=1324776 RepID=UPI002546D5FB|nr:uncharacterized protein N7483_001533 [Penicillium malachiteum]KAJ5736408.1 hypothetical protein N7483_001533 [Penicillium malachiteum]
MFEFQSHLLTLGKLVCNEQAALAGGCYKGYLDKDCTCPSVPYLDALKRCLKAACPYSDWESKLKVHVKILAIIQLADIG